MCLTGAKCQSCSAGYYMQQDSTCAPCSSLTPNCFLCFDGNSTKCISCEQTYQLVSGACVGNGSSTSISSSGGSSSNVNQRSQGNNPGQSQGNNQQSQGISQGDNQESQGYNQQSLGSSQGQSQGNNQGQSQGNNQQAYSGQNAQNYNGGCDPSLISINGVCYPTIPFCQAYNQTDGTCTLCTSIFALSNGYCLPSTLISGSTSAP